MSAMSDFTFMERKEESLFINSPNTLDNEKLNPAEIEKDEIENIDFVCISPEELKVPSYVKQGMKDKGIPYVQTTDLESVMPELDIL